MIHYGYTDDYREWARYHDGGSPCYEPPREPRWTCYDEPAAEPVQGEMFEEESDD